MSTVEEQLQAQRAQAAEPPTRAESQRAQIAALVTAAVAGAAGATVVTAPPAAVATASLRAADRAREAVGRILAGFDAYAAARRTITRALVIEIVGSVRDVGVTEQEAAELAAEEDEREARFAAASKARLARDLPRAVAREDAQERRDAVDRLLQREHRFSEQREAEIQRRARAMAKRAAVRRTSVDGAYWHLNPLLDNCATCRAMAGKVWPWSVLNLFRPPVHPQCACELFAIREAIARGLITGRDADFRTYDEFIGRRDLLEAAGRMVLEAQAADEVIVADLDFMETRYADRYGPLMAVPPEPARGGRKEAAGQLELPIAEHAEAEDEHEDLDGVDDTTSDDEENGDGQPE